MKDFCVSKVRYQESLSSLGLPSARWRRRRRKRGRCCLVAPTRPAEAPPVTPPAPGALPALCDPSRLAHRLLVLLLMCFLGFGSCFCYDNPAALQTQVKRDMQVNTTKFMMLYAWYSWPNVVFCSFGGFFDRLHIWNTMGRRYV